MSIFRDTMKKNSGQAREMCYDLAKRKGVMAD